MLFPQANPALRPSPWWYFGRAVFVSRRDYRRIFLWFVGIGLPIGIAGIALHVPLLRDIAYALGALGLAMLGYSLVGLYRMYGHPSRRYLAQLLRLGGITGAPKIADLHIGTYRHAYEIASLLPLASIVSIDCWDPTGPAAEEAVEDVRQLEPPPQGHPQIRTAKADKFTLPLPDASCDVVLFGFGTHEIPVGAPREKLFCEASRVLRVGGRALLFEHGVDVHNFLIFGPVIKHVTRRRAWLEIMRRYFNDVRYKRSSHAVDLMAATKVESRR
jgi:ubiquinone/menaquinone biosynthesis C-methylase UbiE